MSDEYWHTQFEHENVKLMMAQKDNDRLRAVIRGLIDDGYNYYCNYSVSPAGCDRHIAPRFYQGMAFAENELTVTLEARHSRPKGEKP